MEKLKILIFMPEKINAIGANHELASRLVHCLETRTEMDFRNSTDGLSSGVLSGYNLVHIMGSWDCAAIGLQHKAHRLHIPTIYSPLGGLQPWMITKHRSSYRYALQRAGIRHASAVHVSNRLEAETFEQLGWNRRWELIENPVLTNRLTFEEMTSMMQNFYQKVLDSNVRLLLSPLACQTIGHLLQLGVDKDAIFEQNHCNTMKKDLAGLTASDWRRISIYAADEAIEDLLSKGLERLHMPATVTTTTHIDRFDNNSPYTSGDLSTEALCFKSISLLEKIGELIKEEEKHEREICTGLLNLKYELEHHAAPLRHLANLYTLFRTKDVNEDRLKELIGQLGIKRWSANLMTVIHNVMRLPEGFMPFAGRQGREVRKLEKSITKFCTWT